MHLVISFDFGLNSNVALHAATQDYEQAKGVYERLVEQRRAFNAEHMEHGAARLVELISIPSNEYLSDTGHVMFWGGADKNVIVQNNNEYGSVA